jgi:methyltransferase (TIGR00027 family)
MKVRRSLSGTAQNVAAYRALENEKPAHERLFADPYAKRFLPWVQRAWVKASRLPVLRRRIERYADGLAPGARTSAIARTRLIDDWLRKEVATNARQVVILGAGFDCRALRLPELAGLPVFEVDRPAMVAFKNRRLTQNASCASLKRVAVDFLKDSIADRLLDAGYSRSVKTVFIWEGVTNYLDNNSVAAVFDFVARNTPADSKIIFTYVHADAIAGCFDAPGLKPLLALLQERGEPWTFGFDPRELSGYLAERGLRLTMDLSAGEYRKLYWPMMPGRGHGYEFYHVAMAETSDAAPAMEPQHSLPPHRTAGGSGQL